MLFDSLGLSSKPKRRKLEERKWKA